MDTAEIRINTAHNGRRFAFVGNYTVREGKCATNVTRDIDGDEVRLITLATFGAGLAWAYEAKA